MSSHILLLLLAGFALLGAFVLPTLLRKSLLTMPIIFVAFGYLIFSLPLELPLLNPEDTVFDRQLIEYITEIIVIISLAGTGLKMKRRIGWKSWSTGWYLLGIAMPLMIAVVAGLSWWWIGLAPASAILLGAVLAPTDPGLAAKVQVGPPDDDSREDEVRFGLTLEAGLNDGLAFPFVYLALALVQSSDWGAAVLTWTWWDFGYRIGMGLLGGYCFGKMLSWAFYYFTDKMVDFQDTRIQEGFFILAATLITYSLTEMAEGYGFLAVFVAAVVSGQQAHSSLESRQESYEAIGQVEQAILAIFLVAFGGITATGGLADLSWPGALLGLGILLVIRPLCGMLAFIPSQLPWVEKLAISYFGIRGVGSLYYLAYAHNSEQFPEIDNIWSIVNFTMLASIFLHGLTAQPILRWIDRRMEREI